MTNERIYELTNIMKDVYEDLATLMNEGKPEQQYTTTIITEHTYTVTARDEQEAAIKAVRLYDAEGKSSKPIPAVGKVVVNGETIIGEDIDPTTDEEYDEYEDEPEYTYCSEDENGMAICRESYDELIDQLADTYRLTDDELDELSCIDFDEMIDSYEMNLPFTTLYISREKVE